MRSSTPISDAEISIPLPRGWKKNVIAGLVCAVSLTRKVLLEIIPRLENSPDPRVQLAAEVTRTKQRNLWLEEEMRIKDARMAQIPAAHRPRYTPELRWRIVTLRASAGWSIAETARRFALARSTIADWVHRVEGHGRDGLLELPDPVNRFPNFVTVLVKRLKTINPLLGRKKIAGILARGGLAISASSAERFLKRKTKRPPPSIFRRKPKTKGSTSTQKPRIVTAKRPHHVWHADLTVVPAAFGLWVPWLPRSLPIVWPCCWWVCVVVDHHSRAVVGYAVFEKEPTSRAVCTVLERAAAAAGQKPKYIISDKGVQFRVGYRRWCKRRTIKPRFGAIGKHGSIAVVERFILTMKREWTWRILIPLRKRAMERSLASYVAWYNAHRPHDTLGGATPEERLTRKRTAKGPIEVRPRYPIPKRGPKAKRPRRVDGELELVVSYLDGHTELPVIELREAA
ncbi:MAG: DDE-type integrase/transposase/recombinase [Deltaproteobacteria bacterium]|nr:DDE-type integrase/transposase/recombinase [Deltaproteobacteria bacterium]